MASLCDQETASPAPDDEYYLSELYKVLDAESLGFNDLFPKGITKVLDFLYLGGEGEAKNKTLVKQTGFTHVINCAAEHLPTGPKYYGEDINYLEFYADDDDDYDMMQHFEDTFATIEKARESGGKVLLHCIVGVNRSGALATAYCMIHLNIDLITAATLVKKARKCLLTNLTFRKQLITFARKRNLLPQVKSTQ